MIFTQAVVPVMLPCACTSETHHHIMSPGSDSNSYSGASSKTATEVTTIHSELEGRSQGHLCVKGKSIHGEADSAPAWMHKKKGCRKGRARGKPAECCLCFPFCQQSPSLCLQVLWACAFSLPFSLRPQTAAAASVAVQPTCAVPKAQLF